MGWSMKRKVNRVPGAHMHNSILVELSLEAIPVTPEMKLEPRKGRPQRPPVAGNGEKPARPKRKKKSD